MKNQSFLVLLLNLFFFSCESPWGEYGGYAMEYDSAMEYYIILNKGEVIFANDIYKEKSKKGLIIKYFRPSGVVDSLLLGKGGIVIESFVKEDNVSFDSTFILVDQKPLSNICECNEECLSEKYKNPTNLRTYKMCKEALEKSTFHQYWIIDKTKDNVYGPLTKEEYFRKREELKIPKNLQIEVE